jgi:YbbR domain-containing protein
MAYHPFRHLGLKFLSVAVALGLWFTVAGEQTVERTLRVPLELGNWPERLELVEQIPPDTVDVRVRGASGLLSQLSVAEVVATVDLSLAKEGPKYVYLTPRQVRVPPGVEVVEVTPGTVTLRFEKSASKRVPVVPVVDGEPAPGYEKGKAKVEPETVEIAGAESALQRLKEAKTEPVSVAGARSQVREIVTIGVPDVSLRLTTPVSATVTVPIHSIPTDRLVRQVPVRVRSAGRGLSAQVVPAAVAVSVRGPKDVVEGLQPDSVGAFVDLAGLGPGRYNLSVRLEPAQEFVVVRAEPAIVQVRIK